MRSVRRYGYSAASVVLGAALAAVAFGAKGGSELTRATVTEALVVLACGVLLALFVAFGRWSSLPGGTALFLFAALAVLTALSVTWSIVPELSWLEANRTLSYLAVFAAAIVAARVAPGSWRVVLNALVLFAAAVCAYALASRVWPGSLAETEIYARIGAPYGYWNAVGVTAALAVPPAVWLGARRSGHPPLNALAYPLLGILFVALFLSYSRGSLLAAGLGVALWLLLVPLRLRSLLVLGVSAAVASPVIAWALAQDAFTKDNVAPTVREAPAGEFGLLLGLMCLVLLLAGVGVGFLGSRRAPSVRARRRFGVAAVAVACALPLVLFSSVAVSERGLTGTISDRIDELTSEEAATPGGPGRLTKASSSRGRYWRQAGQIFSDRPSVGTGAGTFGVARLRYRNDQLVARHAHGFFAQTMADLGIAGLAATLLLAVAWLLAALRTLGLEPRVRRRRRDGLLPHVDWTPERVGLAAMALCAFVFGVHSAIDWTWFTPGPAVAAIAAAGFVAGRGPAGIQAGDFSLARERLTPPRLAAAAVTLLVAVGVVWAIVQPERAAEASGRALALAEERKFERAAEEARRAHEIDPLSARPLLTLAAVEEASGDTAGAEAAYADALVSFPGDAQNWIALAEFQLRRGRPADALRTVQGALYLDPRSRTAQEIFLLARRQLREGLTPVQPAPSG